MKDSFVTVTAYTTDRDARTAQGALDHAGIDAVVDDAADRVKVRVDNVDALRAGDTLTRNCPDLEEIEEADEEPKAPVCPACASSDIEASRRAHTFALIVAVAIAVGVAAAVIDGALFAAAAAGIYLLTGGRWRCTACGETWD